MHENTLMDETRLREQAQQLLRTVGPLTPRDLADRLGTDDEPVPDPQWVHSVLLDDATEGFAAYPLVDSRLVDLDDLLDGLVLTHVLTDAERDTATLTVETDLAPLLALSLDGQHLPLADGATATFGSGLETLSGPPGWLPDAPVAVATVRDGAVQVTGAEDTPPVDTTTVERLARTFAMLDDTTRFAVDEIELIVEARARTPRLLSRPEAPLDQLFEAAGIRDRGDTGLAWADEPDDADGADDADDGLVEHLQRDHQLDGAQATAVMELSVQAHLLVVHMVRQTHGVLEDAIDALADGADDAELAGVFDRVGGLAGLMATAVEDVLDPDEVADTLGHVLGDASSTVAVVQDVVGSDTQMAVAVLLMLETRRGRDRDRRDRANMHWLQARMLELADRDHVQAERELRRAREADQDHPEATFDLARYLADRGQAGAASGLLGGLEGPGVAERLEQLAPFTRPGPTSAGRNQPCPCGSGRKHKVCCGPHNGWPLAERLDWLWQKVVWFSVTPVAAALIDPVADAAGFDEGDPAAMHDAAVANMVLFEGGMLALMADLRGPLLPADELDLLRGWATTRAGVYEAVEVDPGRGVLLLDLTTGDRIAVADQSMSRSLSVRDAVLAWVVNDPDGPAPAGGGVRIPNHAREGALSLLDLDPSADDLASWYAALHAPPQLRNQDGDPLVLSTLTYRVDDPAAARAALAEAFETDGDTFTALVDDPPHQWVRGTITLADHELVVSTNSTPRAARLADQVRQLVADAELVDEERIPARELAGRSDPDAIRDQDPSAELLNRLSDDERTQLEEQFEVMITAHEDAWVDTELDALGGVSPRAAAVDPTRRDDLLRLLDEIADHAERWDSPGRPMDADRLARLLDL